ncbi:MAG: thioredoxin-dependent thiol peroxidase [Chloroflexi bacterium]|nr:thioredoxin-dependent thiol peroxidase [Chloroflexota bacterium]
MPMPAVGDAAPPLELPDQHGNTIRLADLAGKWVVLYFYPKDDTAGCTKEACSFRDQEAAIAAAGARVLGVSGDSVASHGKFAAKYSLPFSLLADAGNAVARAYGAFGPKSMYGRSYEGVLRSTFVIDPGGRVAHAWTTVKVATHGADVLAWLREHAA